MYILIDNKNGTPIYDQIYTQIKNQILSGELEPDSALPSIRALAKDLRISVITTKRAYDELENEGFLYTLPGKGCFVCGCPANDPQQELKCLNTLEETVQRLLAMGYTRQELIQKIEEADPCSK